MSRTIICCDICGKSFIREYTNRRYCSPECSMTAKRAQARQYKRLEREAIKSEREKPKREEAQAPRRRALFDLSGKSLADVAAEALALGMSYGEYTAACAGGTIYARLDARGISHQKARALMAKAKKGRA